MSPVPEELVNRLADQASVRDVFADLRAEHGRDTTRYVAETFGVSRATAWRALRGQTRNPKFSETDRFRNARAAAALRRVQTIDFGTAPVRSVSKGVRRPPAKIGALDTGQLRWAPGEIGPRPWTGILDSASVGDWQTVFDNLGYTALNAYGDLAGGDPELGALLEIDDWSGVRFE